MSETSTLARVTVRLKRAILDPQGRAVQGTLHRLGHDAVEGLRVGKVIEFTLPGTPEEVRAQVDAIAADVLANPVMEDVEVTLEPVPASEGETGA